MAKFRLNLRRPSVKWVKIFFLYPLVIGGLLFGLVSVFQYTSGHDKQYRYISEALDPVVEKRSIVDWEIPEKITGRQFTNSDGGDAGLALTEAWASLLLAARSGDPEFMEDHFDGSAFLRAREFVTGSSEALDRGMVVLRQTARPRFFHLDGSVIELVSDDLISVRYELDNQRKNVNLLSITRECSRQIMALYSVGWKIRNHEIDCVEPIDPYIRSPLRRPINFPLKGMNYYPSDTPWHEFWDGFDVHIIEADLAVMQGIGVNSIRMFIPYNYFSDSKTSKVAHERLDQFLSLAAEKDISVIPTLFDFRSSYQSTGWAEEYAYMRKVVGIIKKHSNVQIIDLKNEPDLDYQHVGEAQVNAWLVVFTGLLKDLAPEISVTIGWLDYAAAVDSKNLVDVVSYHEYGDLAQSRKIYGLVKNLSGEKPVIVTETGIPSWNLAVKFPFSKETQADWLETQLKNLNTSDGVFVWTLYDFDYKDAGMVATIPWRRAMQASFGLFSRQGTPKPAAQVFQNFEFFTPTPFKNKRS